MRSTSNGGKLFVCYRVNDFEGFGVERGIGAETEFAEVALLHLDEEFFVLGLEAVHDAWVDDDLELEVGFVAPALFQNLGELALDLDAHGEGALNLAAAFAVRAIVVNGGAHGFAVALAGHFHE